MTKATPCPTLEMSYDVESEVTAGGALVGGSVGASVGAEFRITSGMSTTYTGVVGAIDADDFSANQYSFGLFTYVHRDARTGREFEVLNYWVE